MKYRRLLSILALMLVLSSFTTPAYATLVSYNETSGLYKYDSINDFTPGMWTNGTTYIQLGDGVDRQSVYDWEIETWGSYVAGGGYAQWDFTLVNTREENEPGLTDNQTGSYEYCIFDDAGDAFWSVHQGGAGSYQVILSNETTTKVKGSSSIKMNFTSGGASLNLGVKHTYGVAQDWSEKSFLGLYVYGANTGLDVTVEIRTGAGNYRHWSYVDDFAGWRRIVKPLAIGDSGDSGVVDLSNVDEIHIYYNGVTSPFVSYLDRTVVDSAIPCPVELGVPDDTVQALLYGYDGSGYHEYMRWEFNGSTYSWINPGALYWNASSPVAAGRLAKQAAWGNYTWSGAPAGATKTPTQAAQTALNLTYWGHDATRLMMQADYVDNELASWNEKTAQDKGSPWAPSYIGFSVNEGKLGTTLVNSGTSITLHRINDYAVRNYIVPVDQPVIANWQHDTSADTYSYEFYLDNDNAAAQNATVEMYVPDNVTTYRVAYWNGTDYVTFIDYGSTYVAQPQSINGTLLDAAFYFNGFRNQTKAVLNATAGLAGIGPRTYNPNCGVMNRAAFTIALGADDGDAAGPDGADEVKLKVTVVYGGDGEVTYEFENSTAQHYGLQNIDGNMVFLFNPDATQPSGYLGVLFEERPTALFLTADENKTITAFEFNVTGDWTVIDSSFDTSATVTAVTGETISELSEYTGYYPDHAYYERGETGAAGAVEGSTLVPATHVYQKPAGSRYMVAAKIPLPPYGNGTASLSTAKLRFKTTVPTGAKYTAKADLSSPASTLWVATLFCDFQRDSYNIRPRLPMKNLTVELNNPHTGTAINLTYNSTPGQTAAERMNIQYITVNGTKIQSQVIPSGYLSGSGNITVQAELGDPTTPTLTSVAQANLTSVTWDSEKEILRATTNRDPGTSTITVDVGDYGEPIIVQDALSYTYNKATGTLTVTLSHSSPATAVIRWAYTEAGDVINRVPSYLPLLGISIMVLAASVLLGVFRNGLSPDAVVTFIVLAIVVMITTVILWQFIDAVISSGAYYP